MDRLERIRRIITLRERLLCSCGKPIPPEDAAFWGECEKCREQLPIHTCQGGDSYSRGENQYHGGRYNRGEW